MHSLRFTSLAIGCCRLRVAHSPMPSLAQDYAAIVAAPDRADSDRQTDQRRDPVKLLAFTGVKTGMTVLDMGAGGGYSTELMARAVGASGKVYAQDHETAARAKERFEARMKTDAMKNVVALDRPFDDPLPADVSNARSHHVLLFLPRHHLHGGRSRGDEQEAVRGAQARRFADHRRSFGQGRRGHLGRQDAAPDRAEHAREARCWRRASQLIAAGEFLRHPEDTARGEDFRRKDADRRVRAEIPEAELSHCRKREARSTTLLSAAMIALSPAHD